MTKRLNLRIRDAQDDERETIRNVTLAAYEEYSAVMPRPVWEGYRQQLLSMLDKEEAVERLVAESDGLIVGSVLLYPSQAKAYASIHTRTAWPEIRLLAVAPEAREQGIGSVIMDECERRAYNAGATMLGLHTMDMMQAAMRLYEQRGFMRAPELDFSPAKGLLVKGYCLNLSKKFNHHEE